MACGFIRSSVVNRWTVVWSQDRLSLLSVSQVFRVRAGSVQQSGLYRSRLGTEFQESWWRLYSSLQANVSHIDVTARVDSPNTVNHSRVWSLQAHVQYLFPQLSPPQAHSQE
jgi:hypothetical protein